MEGLTRIRQQLLEHLDELQGIHKDMATRIQELEKQVGDKAMLDLGAAQLDVEALRAEAMDAFDAVDTESTGFAPSLDVTQEVLKYFPFDHIVVIRCVCRCQQDSRDDTRSKCCWT